MKILLLAKRRTLTNPILENGLLLRSSVAREIGKTLLLAVLLFLPAGLCAEAVENLQGRYGAVVRITMPDRSEEFQCVLVLSKNEATLTVVPKANDKGVFVIHADRSTTAHKGRYWIKSSSSPDVVEPWVDSFDANAVPMMATLYDPTFPACAYLRCKDTESKEYLVLQNDARQAKFRRHKKDMYVDTTFQLDQKGRIVSFQQDLTNSSYQVLPIRKTSLSNYDVDGLGDIPQNISTTLTLLARFSEATPRPTRTISSTMEILSREPLPKDFTMAAYLDSATKGFREVTVNYEARARSVMPTPSIMPERSVMPAQTPTPNKASGGPKLPSYGEHKVYTHLLLAVGGVLVILGGALLFRKKVGG